MTPDEVTRRRRRTLIGLLLLAACAAPGPAQERAAAGSSRPDPDARQIFWQRSLRDALALQEATHRPILIAVSMDGESASDRIVGELYRDPRFVDLTRACICVVASLYRHTPRDHDAEGRRIPCPKLGEVTCGEHVALEPLLYAKHLSDGERVAPRHALILADGRKEWDLSLSFDLLDVQRRLEASVAAKPAGADPGAGSQDPGGGARWPALAARRDHRGRCALEAAIHDAAPAEIGLALDAVARAGDPESVDALRIVAMRLPSLPAGMADAFRTAAQTQGLESPLSEALRGAIGGVEGGWAPTRPEDEPGRTLVPVLAALDGSSATTRAFLLACRSIRGAPAADAMRLAFGEAPARAIEEAVAAKGGPVSLRAALAGAAAVTRSGGGPDSRPAASFPAPGPITDAMPEEPELERRLAEVEPDLVKRPEDPGLLARHAKTCLDLARRRIEAEPTEARALLRRAEDSFWRALESRPEVAEWWIERARAAYFRESWAEEAAFGWRALALAAGLPEGRLPDESAIAAAVGNGTSSEGAAAILADGRAIEALRWIADGEARLAQSWSGLDPERTAAQMTDSARALAIVAMSPYADGSDWCALASSCGTFGLAREELAVLREALVRLPAARDVRELFLGTLWNAGRIDLAAGASEDIVAAAPRSAEARWYTGQAWRLLAENHRRLGQPDAAVAAYASSRAWFELAAAMSTGLAADCRAQTAADWLGAGMALVSGERRESASRALVEAARARIDLATLKDGLGCDVFDLVDKILEWRATGPSPVDPAGLLDALQAASPGDPLWARAISDAELREALRADGRNPARVEGETVDASGRPVRTLVGLPTEEGDRYLRASIAAARRSLAAEASATREAAQTLTIWGERRIASGRPDEARESLGEAAGLAGLDAPASRASDEEWARLAARLRAALGPARPRLRPGR